MRMDRDHRDRLFRGNRSDDVEHLGPRQPKTAGTPDFHLDQIAILGLADIGRVDLHFLAAPFDRHQACTTIRHHPHNAHDRTDLTVEDLDHTGRIGRTGTVLVGEDLGKHPVAEAADGRFALGAVGTRLADEHGGCRTGLIGPFRRTTD